MFKSCGLIQPDKKIKAFYYYSGLNLVSCVSEWDLSCKRTPANIRGKKYISIILNLLSGETEDLVSRLTVNILDHSQMEENFIKYVIYV